MILDEHVMAQYTDIYMSRILYTDNI